jgi:hypothetical protein
MSTAPDTSTPGVPTPGVPTPGVPAPGGPPDRAAPGRHRPGIRWDRVVGGLLVAAVGVASLLQATGTAVPWALLPASALVLVGVVLLVGLAGGSGRGGVIAVGIALLVAAVGVGIGADRFAGPVGDRTVGTDPADWSDTTTRSAAGTVTVDLTGAPPPATGRMRVELGAGRVVVVLPDEGAVRIEARIVAGTVVVDGAAVQQGVDLYWTGPVGPAPAPALTIDIGTGDLEVRHGAS